MAALSCVAGIARNTIVDAKVSDMAKAGRKDLAIAKGVATCAEKLESKQYQERLLAAGITSGPAEFRHLTVAGKKRSSVARHAVQLYLHEMYKRHGRDFAKAFSYPEFLEVEEGVFIPIMHVWDRPHGLKNARMAVAHAAVALARKAAGGGRAAPAAPSPAAAPRDAGLAAAGEGGAGDDDANAADEDGDEDDEDDEAAAAAAVAAAPTGSLVELVAVAARAIIATEGQTLLHAKTLDPLADPQHVPTAERLFSLATAAEMKRLGHDKAAAFVHDMACDYLSIDKRGFSPAARWRAWRQMDARVHGMDESFTWDPTSTEWHSPTGKRSIEGFSRVLTESFLVSNDTSRLLDLMIGAEGISFVRDRGKSSDLCECFFSCCVAKMRQDKVTKFQWIKHLPSIIRMYQRKMMDAEERRTPLNTQQRHVYKYEDMVQGFRCCCCVPVCVIGGAVNPQCACAKHGRHQRQGDKLVLRASLHAEESTRNKYNKRKRAAGDMDVDE